MAGPTRKRLARRRDVTFAVQRRINLHAPGCAGLGGCRVAVEMVNGYPCKNCTDIDYANKHIDPKHPKDGPYRINAKTDPSSPQYQPRTEVTDPSVKFGGSLQNLNANAVTGAVGAASASQTRSSTGQPLSQQTGQVLNLTA
jgi:hypothetical protein